MEGWPSGRRRRPGKLVCGNSVSWVRIPSLPSSTEKCQSGLMERFRKSSMLCHIGGSNPPFSVFGRVPERFNGAVLKTVYAKSYRGFKSHPFRVKNNFIYIF